MGREGLRTLGLLLVNGTVNLKIAVLHEETLELDRREMKKRIPDAVREFCGAEERKAN